MMNANAQFEREIVSRLKKARADNEVDFTKAQVKLTSSSVQSERERSDLSWLDGDKAATILREAGLDLDRDFVKAPVQEVISLLRTSCKSDDGRARPFSISCHRIVGQSKKNFLSFSSEFHVRIPKDEWTLVPLLSKSVALKRCSIHLKKRSNSNNKRTRESVDEVENSNAIVCVMKSGYCLLTHERGDYSVILEYLSEYSTKSQTGVKLSIPSTSAITSLKFSVPMNDISIAVEPCLRKTTMFDEIEKSTVISADLSPSDTVQIQWTKRLEESIENETEIGMIGSGGACESLSMNASIDTLFVVGDGVISGYSLFSFTIVRGSVSTIDIVLPDENLKVLNVEGSHILKWEITGSANGSGSGGPALVLTEISGDGDDGAENDEDDEEQMEEESSSPVDLPPRRQRVLRIVLDVGFEDSYSCLVVHEMDRRTISDDHEDEKDEDVSSSLNLGSFLVISDGIERIRGIVSVAAKESFEVMIGSSEGLTTCAPEELSKEVSQFATNPMIFASKFVISDPQDVSVPYYRLRVNVIKHENAQMLVASVDVAHYTVTVTEEGNALVSCIYQLRNSQKQYARVTLPLDSEIWSTTFDGNTCRPASESDRICLIPIKTASKRRNAEITVALTSFLNVMQMKKSGSLELAFPRIDIPISRLCVTLYLPKNFRYGEFKGSLREVKRFSGPVPTEGQTRRMRLRERRGQAQPMMMMQQQSNAMTNIAINPQQPAPQMMMKSFGVKGAKNVAGSRKARKGGEAGVLSSDSSTMGMLPVHVEVPKAGNSYLFEDLVVLDREVDLSVPYRRIDKSWFKKRRV